MESKFLPKIESPKINPQLKSSENKKTNESGPKNASRGTQEIDKEASDAIVAQKKSFVNVKNGIDDSEATLKNIFGSIKNYDSMTYEEQKQFVNAAKECCQSFCGAKNFDQIDKILSITFFLLNEGSLSGFNINDRNCKNILMRAMKRLADSCALKDPDKKNDDVKKMFDQLSKIENKLTPQSRRQVLGHLMDVMSQDDFLKDLDEFKTLDKTYQNHLLKDAYQRMHTLLNKTDLGDLEKNYVKKHFESFRGDDLMHDNIIQLRLLDEAIMQKVITPDNNDLVRNFISKLQNMSNENVSPDEFCESCTTIKRFIDNGFLKDSQSAEIISRFIKLCEEKCKGTDIQRIREIQELKESLPKDEKKEAFRKCLISNQYLMMQKMLNIDDLSKYTSLELNIINKMGAYEYSNPPIEQRVKELIMKEVFGEDFYNANIKSLQKEIDALPEKEKQEKLESINIDLRNELKSNGCLEKINCLQQVINMFDDVYKNEIMKGNGLEALAQHRAVELCFAKADCERNNGFSSTGFNFVSIISGNPTWENLKDIMHDPAQKRRVLKSTMRHELTHYTQGLLRFTTGQISANLSDQAKNAITLFNQTSPKERRTPEDYKKYVLNPKEMGAYSTEILSQLEETCGLEYGEFCFQEEGRYDEKHKDREDHAKKIVDKLDKYLQENKGKTLAQFLNTPTKSPDGTTRHGFSRLLDLLTFDVHDSNGKAKMIVYDDELQLSSEQLTSDKANEEIAKCFEHLLEYIIPRADMKLIAEKLGSQDNTFIEEEKQIINPTVFDEQIEACESQIQLYGALLEKMQMQDGSICMPSINYLSSQIEELEKNRDVIKYKESKTQLEEAQASKKDTKELSEEVGKYSTLPIVSSYIYLNQLKNHFTLIDLQNQLKNINLDNPQEAKKEIERIKVQMPALRPEYKQNIEAWFKYISENLDKLEKNVKLRNMSIEDKQRYIKHNHLDFQNESELLSDIKGCQVHIKLLESINNGAQDIYESRDSLKDVFQDNKINKAIEDESIYLRWYNTINNLKNLNDQEKINHLSTILRYWQEVPKIAKVLEKYKEVLVKRQNRYLPKPGDISFNQVLNVFKNLYNEVKATTNMTILENQNNTNRVEEAIKQCNTKLANLKDKYNNELNETIDNYARKLKNGIKEINFVGPLDKQSIQSIQSTLDSYKEEKVKMEDIKALTSEIMYERYEYERARNRSGDSRKKLGCSYSPLEKSFHHLKRQLTLLPKGIQSQLNHYLNWANRGLAKFQDWCNGLIK